MRDRFQQKSTSRLQSSCLLLLVCLGQIFIQASAADARGSSGCTSDLGMAVECDLEGLLMSDIQTVGSHNSYKLAIPEAELELIRQFNPRSALTLDYSHLSLDEQLNLGLGQ